MSNRTSRTLCAIDLCDRPAISRGMCQLHYRRWRDWGDPRPELPPRTPPPYRSPQEQFEARFAEAAKLGPDPCWIWEGTVNQGYGVIKRHRLPRLFAHRLSYEKVYGEIPEGLQVDHICRHPACFNPNHLRAVTQKQNNENRGTYSRRSSSGFRGVYYMKHLGKWVARTKHFKATYEDGPFDTVEEAYAAVVKLRLRVHTHNDVDRAST